MNITQEKIDDLNAVLKVQVEPADYKAQVDDAVRKYSKKVNMPGFRPGMVPASIVRKMYGKALFFDEINRIVADSVDKYITDNNLQLLGNPLPKAENDIDFNFEKPSSFEFAFEMGLAPEIQLTIPPADSFTYYEISVSDAMINEEVDKLAKRHGEFTNPDVVDADCSVYGKFEELNADGTIKEGGKSNSAFMLLNKINDDAVRQQFIGKVANDHVDFNPVAAISAKEEVKYLLGIKEGEVEDYNTTFRCTIERINKSINAELNQAFFDKVYGEGAVTDEAAFRERVKAELAEGYKYESENWLRHEMEDYFLEKSNLQLPDEFLKRWLKHSNEKITDEQLENEYHHYSRDLRWQLIENKLFREQEMNVTPEEIENYARMLVMDQYARYGMAHLITEEQMQDMVKKYLQNRQSVERAYQTLTSRKVFEYLNQNVNKTVKAVSYDEFLEMTRHHHHH